MGREQVPSICVKPAAERHKDRSDAERRKEGFRSERAGRSQALGRQAENATAKAKGFGASLRFTAVAAAYSSMRLPGFDAGREPRASRYLFSREASQKFANFFLKST